MRNKLTYVCLTLLAFLSCSKQFPKTDPHETARQAAERYYNFLMENKFDSLVLGIYAPDSLPADYRSQLANAMAQYKMSETKRRGGLTAFQVTGDSIMADSINGYVTIRLTFADKSTEQTILPLIYDNEKWKMK